MYIYYTILMCLKANNKTEPDALLCSINKRVSKHWKRHQTIQYDDLLFQLLFFHLLFQAGQKIQRFMAVCVQI